MSKNVYDRNQLLKLAAWARLLPEKNAFVDPGGTAPMPPGGAPPMPPEMIAGGMPAGDPMMAAPPMDPAMMAGGGAPPVDPMMAAPPGAAPPPVDPSVQAMGDQEMMRKMIQEELQKALGSGEGGVAAGGVKKGGNKFEDALHVLEEKMKEQSKIFVAALRNAGIEIPLADLYGIDKADGSGAAAGAPTAAQAQPGLSETLQTGMGGDAPGGQPGKIAQLTEAEQQVAQLTKLAQTRDRLQRSALAGKLHHYDPAAADLSYLAGLFR